MIKVTHNIQLDGDDIIKKREEIENYFLNTYTLFEELYEHIGEEKYFYEKSDPLRHPHIFYLGHTAAFYINKLILATLIQDRVNPEFESIFAVGVDEMDWDSIDERAYQWPSLAQTQEYRQEVKSRVLELIRTIPFTLPITTQSPMWVILMAIAHERIHIETSSVLIRQTPLSHLKPLAGWPICTEHGYAPENELLPIPAGVVIHNKTREDTNYFGWDNEFGFHEAEVIAFKASKYLVSNKEFLAFVEDGGYQKSLYWSDAGNRWREYTHTSYPRFWVKKGDFYKIRFLAHEVDFMYDHPVEVNYHEAQLVGRKEGYLFASTHRR